MTEPLFKIPQYSKTNIKIKNSIKYTFRHNTRQYQELHFFFFQALPRFVYSFGQRHPKCVPVPVEAPGLGMLTGAVPTTESNLCMKINTKKKIKNLHQHDSNSSTFPLWVVSCPFTFLLFASTSTRSLIHFLTKYKLLHLKTRFVLALRLAWPYF